VTNSDPILVVEDVHAAYLQKEILRGVSLAVHAGEVVSLLGENGSGKSTTLKVIAGLLKPSRGTIRYRGRELNGHDTAQRQRLGLGYLMQGGRVFPNLTVEENFNLAAAYAADADCERGRLGDFFSLLQSRRRDLAGLLSGGQRQMLAIELVLAQRPEVLLLDEPTGALSGDLALQVLTQIRDYVRRRRAAALLVEHNFCSSNFATHTLHLTNGVLLT
jgi:ABC-type branched-subunit amino acid transport system ATPase component